jgi:hypothetical protein
MLLAKWLILFFTLLLFYKIIGCDIYNGWFRRKNCQ